MNQKHYHIHGEITEINTTFKDVKDVWVMGPPTSLLNFTIWPAQKKDGSLRTTVDYQKLSQVVTLIAAAVPDTMSLLKQINTSLGMWYAGVDLANAFFSAFVQKDWQKQCTAGRIPLQFCLRDILTFLSCVIT